jgi:hypothetical protein
MFRRNVAGFGSGIVCIEYVRGLRAALVPELSPGLRMEPPHVRFVSSVAQFALEADVSARMRIAAVIYMMVQAVTFGVGTVLVLATPLEAQAMKLLPVVVIASSIASIPISWWMAPRLQARFWRAKRMRSDFISGPAVATSNS